MLKGINQMLDSVAVPYNFLLEYTTKIADGVLRRRWTRISTGSKTRRR